MWHRHPGGTFWHLWGALGGHGSSRKDTLGSGVRFVSTFERFRNFISRAFRVLRAQLRVFFMLVSRSFLDRFLNLNLDIWGSQNKDLVLEGLQKPTCRKSMNSDDFRIDILCFSEALGATFLIFAVLETGLKIVCFSRSPWGSRMARQNKRTHGSDGKNDALDPV